MCYFSQQTKDAATIKRVFKAQLEQEERLKPTIFNGFTYPHTPVITNSQPNTIRWLQWGLIPHWSKDDSIRKHTLNARLETVNEKPAFRNVVKNRCVIIADGFYEWKWLDEKGKQKQRYLICTKQSEVFAFGGLWSKWVNQQTGEELETYTILTQTANPLMAEIHNTKKRMPLILLPNECDAWLNGTTPMDEKDVELEVTPC
jgi:putative SOS response-associated peptidase YedK